MDSVQVLQFVNNESCENCVTDTVPFKRKPQQELKLAQQTKHN